jgi:carboxymethylenebutenolidase
MVSGFVRLMAEGGRDLGAYVVRPASEPAAGLVVVQEISGVNRHICSVAAGYARDGLLAVAPALFDRIEPGVELDYRRAGRQKAMCLLAQLDPERNLSSTWGRD